MIENKPLKLDPAFDEALTMLEHMGKNMFLTGRAGTGKSTLLSLFRQYTKKKCVVLAPTGVAALNVGGQTIHSFCGFPPRIVQAKDIRNHRNKKLYKSIEILIIDEISMVRADMLDSIDLFFRINRDNEHQPFGGAQVLLVGDLYQLPPVISNPEEQQYLARTYETPYFFSANVFEGDFSLDTFELTKVYRQEERRFLQLLEEVRNNTVDYDTLESLNERFFPDFDQSGYISLCARRSTADQINKKKLELLPSPAEVFHAKVTGKFNVRSAPAPMALSLKEGAQVMFVRNDKSQRYVNGTIGVVTELKKDSIKVRISSETSDLPKEIELSPETWEIIKYTTDEKGNIDTETIGSYEQFPLTLAWAITIHKSQGKTFDKVIIDLDRGAFDFGQTYVALSRCKRLDGIVLKQKLSQRDIMVDDRIVDYYRKIR